MKTPRYRHEVVQRIADHRVVAIVREASADAAHRAAVDLIEAGILVLEVSLTTPGATAVIADLQGRDALVGAGTVTDPYAAHDCLAAGARFLVAPNADAEVATLARRRGAAYLPGARTPGEALSANALGADLVKLFPAGDPAELVHLRTVAPHVGLVPTGGVSLADAPEFLRAGAVAVGLGGALEPGQVPALLTALGEVSP